MRVWVFDRLGGIASKQFDINKNGYLFVFTMLGFLWMDREQLGFDPTFLTEGENRFIEIDRNGKTERLVIDSEDDLSQLDRVNASIWLPPCLSPILLRSFHPFSVS